MPLAVEIIGTGETYTTIQAWEDALDNSQQHTGECKAEAFSQVTFAAVAYSAVNYPHLTAVDGAEHDGRAHEVSGAGNARIEFVGATAIIDIRDEYVRVSWLEVKGPGDNNLASIQCQDLATCVIIIRHCIVHNNGASAGTTQNGIWLLDADATFYVFRNIFYGSVAGIGIRPEALAEASQILLNTVFAHNTSAAAGRAGIRVTAIGAGSVVGVVGNAVLGNGLNDIYDTNGALDYNATSDASGAEGANRLANLVTADQFVNPTDTWADTDLTIKAGADLIGAGTTFDPATYPEIDVPISDRGVTLCVSPTTTTAAPTTTSQNPGADVCCTWVDEPPVCDDGTCGATWIRACSGGDPSGTCSGKTGNCHLEKITMGICDPDCRYDHTWNDCDPYDPV